MNNQSSGIAKQNLTTQFPITQVDYPIKKELLYCSNDYEAHCPTSVVVASLHGENATPKIVTSDSVDRYRNR